MDRRSEITAISFNVGLYGTGTKYVRTVPPITDIFGKCGGFAGIALGVGTLFNFTFGAC